MAGAAVLNRPVTKLLQHTLDQILSLHHDVPKLVPLRPRDFPAQCRQIVRQQIPKQGRVIIRKDQLHRALLRFRSTQRNSFNSGDSH